MEQLKILERIQDAGFNVVTCGNCGSVNLVDLEKLEKDNHLITCYDCNKTLDNADMPDLFY